MDKYNRILLGLLALGVLVMSIGTYFIFHADTKELQQKGIMILLSGSLISISLPLFGLYFTSLRNKDNTKKLAEILSQFTSKKEQSNEKNNEQI